MHICTFFKLNALAQPLNSHHPNPQSLNPQHPQFPHPTYLRVGPRGEMVGVEEVGTEEVGGLRVVSAEGWDSKGWFHPTDIGRNSFNILN